MKSSSKEKNMNNKEIIVLRESQSSIVKMASLGFIFFILSFTGCSESTNDREEKSNNKKMEVDKTVSEENFIKILNKYHKDNCIRINLDRKLPISANEKTRDYKKYLNLEKLGLLKSSNTKFDKNKELIYNNGKVEMVNGKKFELTQKGKEIYNTFDNGHFSKAGFCMAHAKVKSLINYTKPKDLMGLTIVNVKYTVEAVGIVPFIEEVVQIEDFNHFKKLTTKNVSQKVRAELILTEMKGWMHSKEFNRLN